MVQLKSGINLLDYLTFGEFVSKLSSLEEVVLPDGTVLVFDGFIDNYSYSETFVVNNINANELKYHEMKTFYLIEETGGFLRVVTRKYWDAKTFVECSFLSPNRKFKVHPKHLFEAMGVDLNQTATS